MESAGTGTFSGGGKHGEFLANWFSCLNNAQSCSTDSVRRFRKDGVKERGEKVLAS